MDNERFQEMVLEELTHISQEIIDIKNRQHIIMVQSLGLAELHLEQKINRLMEEVEFLKYNQGLHLRVYLN